MRLAKARVRLVLLTTFFVEGSSALGSGVLDFLPFMLMGQCLTFMNPQIRQSSIVVMGFVSFVAPSTQAAFKPGRVVLACWQGMSRIGADCAAFPPGQSRNFTFAALKRERLRNEQGDEHGDELEMHD